jgi:hypothetical protein
MAVFDNLLLRYCPSLDSSGNGTTTLNQLDAAGAIVSGGAHMTLTNMELADWVADTTTGGVRALEFDGSNEYLISSSTTAGNLGTSDATIALHANITNASRFAVLAGKRNTSGPFSMYQVMQGHIDAGGNVVSSKKISMFWYNGGTLTSANAMSYCTTDDVVDGNWHHIAVSRTAGFAPKIYIDGVDKALTSVIAGTANMNGDNSIPLQVARSSGAVGYAPMRFDDLLIFNAAKSAGDIAAVAAKRGYLDASIVQSRRRRQSVSGGVL